MPTWRTRARVGTGAVVLALLGIASLLAVHDDWRPRWMRARRANVLLVSLDTLRADRVGCYGYAPAQTPRH